MHLKIGKETVQGYTRVISKVSTADCYSYTASALIAINYLRLNKSKETGLLMGFCISAFRQLLFAKIKRNPESPDRLPLGTLSWGKFCEIPKSIIINNNFKNAIGTLMSVINIWGNHAEK